MLYEVIPEVIARRHLQAEGADRGARMRAGAESNDLWAKLHQSVVVVFGDMVECDMNRHGGLRRKNGALQQNCRFLFVTAGLFVCSRHENAGFTWSVWCRGSRAGWHHPGLRHGS